MNSKVYIILLNYNGWKDTIECLESVLKNDYENYQIIVVDNDSPNNSMEYIINWAEDKQEVIYDEDSQLKHLSQTHIPKPLPYVFYTKEDALNGGDREKESKLNNPIIFIQSGENGGFAAGNNIGIKYALSKDDFEYIWLLNNDTVVESKSLKSLVNYSENNSCDICGTKILNEDGSLNTYGGGFINSFTLRVRANINVDKIPDFISGASFFIGKKAIKEIGLMPEEFFLYFEDAEWTFIAKKHKMKLGMCKDAVITHRESQTTEKSSVLFLYYTTRAKILFSKRFYPLKKYFFYFYLLVKSIVNIANGNIKVSKLIIHLLLAQDKFKSEKWKCYE